MFRKILKSLKIVGVSLFLYWFLFGVLIPFALPKILPKYLSSSFNIILDFKKVKFNPFSFKLSINELEIFDQNLATALKLDEINLDFKPSKIFKKEIFFNSIFIEKPRIFVTINKDGELNLNHILPLNENASSESSESKDEFDYNFFIDKFKINCAQIAFTDASKFEIFHFNLRDLSFGASNLTTKENEKSSINLTSNSNLLKNIKYSGDASFSPLKASAKVKIANLSLPPLWKYLQEESGLKIEDGEANIAFSFNISFSNPILKLNVFDTKISLQNALISSDEFDFKAGNLEFSNKNLNFTSPDKIELLNSEALVLQNSFTTKNESIYLKKGAFKIDDLSFLSNDLNVNVVKTLLLDLELNSNEFGSLKVGKFDFLTPNLRYIDENFSLNSGNLEIDNIKLTDPMQINIKAALESLDIKKLNFEGLKDEKIDLAFENVSLFNGEIVSENEEAVKFDLMDLNKGVFKENLFELSQIALRNSNINLILNEHYEPNFLTLLPKNTPNEKESETKESDFSFLLKEIWLDELNLYAKTHLQNHQIEKLNLKVNNLSSKLNEEIDFHLRVKIDNSKVQSNGKMAISPLKLNSSYEIANFKLSHYTPYIKPFFHGNLTSGTLFSKGRVNFNEDFSLKSNFKLENLFIDDRGELIFKLGLFNLDEISYDKNGVQIGNINIEKPFVNVHIYKDKTINISNLFPQNEKENEKNESSEFNLKLKKISLKDGSFDFKDDSLPLPFKITTKELNGEFSSLDTKENKPSDIRLEGVVGKHGYTKVGGKILPLNVEENLDISLLFKNIDLTSLTPYSGKFVGYAIDDGHLNLDLKYEVKDRLLNGANSIILQDLTLGESIESEEAVNLPLKLAIAILKDSNGKIDINLPVKGDLDNPEFSYGGVILRAVTNLITGIVTSPFKFLGSMLGLDGESLSAIEFEPGFSSLLPPEQAKMPHYKKILLDRPELGLTILSVYDENSDLAALQEKKLKEYIQENEESGYETILSSLYIENFSQEEYEELQKKAKKDEVQSFDFLEAIYKKLITVQEVSKEDLINLAKERSLTIFQALLDEGVEKESLRMEEPSTSQMSKDGWIENPVEISR